MRKELKLSEAQEAHIKACQEYITQHEFLAFQAHEKGFDRTYHWHIQRADSLRKRVREIQAGVNFGIEM